jgi:hypothetical protein
MTTTQLSWPPSWIKLQSEGVPANEKDNIVKSEFQSYIAQKDRKPSVIKNALNDDALKEWSFENISTVVGNEEFEVYVSASGKCLNASNRS